VPPVLPAAGVPQRREARTGAPPGFTLRLRRLGGRLRSWLAVRWTCTAAHRPPGLHSLRSRHSRPAASAPASLPSLAVPPWVRLGRAPRRRRRIGPLGARPLRERNPGDRPHFAPRSSYRGGTPGSALRTGVGRPPPAATPPDPPVACPSSRTPRCTPGSAFRTGAGCAFRAVFPIRCRIIELKHLGRNGVTLPG